MKNTSKTFKRAIAAFMLITGLCGLPLTAQAILIETHEGLELDASMITLPSSENGSLTVKTGNKGGPLRLKTSIDTTTFVIRDEAGNRELVSLVDFAKAMRLIDNRNAMVMVFYRIDSQTVTEALLISQKPLASGPAQQKPITGGPAKQKKNSAWQPSR